MPTGDPGIYRLFRLHPHDGGVHQRLVAVFGVFGGVIVHVEDRDGVLASAFPQGPLTPRLLLRMRSIEDAGYWRLVAEDDIQRGLHPDLAEGNEAPAGPPGCRRPGP